MNRKLYHPFFILIATSALGLGVFAASTAMLPVADGVTAQSSHGFTTPVKGDAVQVPQLPASAARDQAIALPIERPDHHAVLVPTALTAEAAALATVAHALQHPATPVATAQQPRRHARKASRMRQSMAMPFFSFAPRG